MALARGHERGREFGDVAKTRGVGRRRSPMRLRQKNAVAKSRAVRQHRRQPVP